MRTAFRTRLRHRLLSLVAAKDQWAFRRTQPDEVLEVDIPEFETQETPDSQWQSSKKNRKKGESAPGRTIFDEDRRMDEESKPNAEEAFVRHLTTNHDGLLRFVRTLIPNSADAEDVFQRASVTLWKKHGEYDESRPFFPWACRFVHFEVLNYRKRMARDRLAFSDDIVELLAEQQIEQQPDLDQRREALEICIEKLDADEQLILQRRYADRDTVANLAVELNRSPKQLYKILERIRRNLSLCVDAATK